MTSWLRERAFGFLNDLSRQGIHPLPLSGCKIARLHKLGSVGTQVGSRYTLGVGSGAGSGVGPNGLIGEYRRRRDEHLESASFIAAPIASSSVSWRRYLSCANLYESPAIVGDVEPDSCSGLPVRQTPG